MNNLMINAAALTENNHHLSIWLGFALIALSIALFMYSAWSAMRDFVIIRKRYRRARYCMRYLPYPMRRAKY